MIRRFGHAEGHFRLLSHDKDAPLWIDLATPSAEEAAAGERLAGIPLPSREAMREIEPSSRFYIAGETIVLVLTLPAGSDSGAPEFAPVAFLLSADGLVTLRELTPKPFETFASRSGSAPLPLNTPRNVLVGLLAEIVDRFADLLERAEDDLDTLSARVFAKPPKPGAKTTDFGAALTDIGRVADRLARLRHGLVTAERALVFLSQALSMERDRQMRLTLKSLRRDSVALTQHADSLSSKTTLLLDATLGLINIEQSAIIKIFSVVAFVMLPPTLIASIYGMNFEFMPELEWRFAYPAALIAMIFSAYLPYRFFKQRGWL